MNSKKITIKGNLENLKEVQKYLQNNFSSNNIKIELEITKKEESNHEQSKQVKNITKEEREEFKNLLNSDNPDIRNDAALELGISRDPQAIHLLLPKINDPSPEVRQTICHALGEIGVAQEGVVRALIERLDDEDLEVRQIAAQALGKIGSPEAIAPLLTCLESIRSEDEWFIQEAIALAFSRIEIQDDEQKRLVIEALKKLRKNDNVFVLEAASYALAQIPKSTPTNLSNWFKGLDWISKSWETLEKKAGEILEDVVGKQEEIYPVYCIDNNELSSTLEVKCKKIKELEEKGKYLCLILLIEQQTQTNEMNIGLELKSQNNKDLLPVGLKLTIIRESSQLIEHEIKDSDSEENKLEIIEEFSEKIGKAFTLNITYEDVTFTEDFVV